MDLGQSLTGPIRKSVVTKKPYIQKSLLEFVRSGRLRDFPWRWSGATPYNVLLSEVTLKRTTATAANRLFGELLIKFPTLESLYSAPESVISLTLQPIGLYNQRAKAMKKMAEYLVLHEQGTVPKSLTALLQVPGLGPYSARAVLSFGHNIPAAVVDSNVVRIYERVFLRVLPNRTSVSVVQAIADELLLEDNHRDHNYSLLDLGSIVCRPTRPRCHECPLSVVCDYFSGIGTIQEGSLSPEPKSRLRELRDAKGLTLVGLAKAAGVSKMTLVNMEAGRTKPRPETLQKIAKAMGVRANDLVDPS